MLAGIRTRELRKVYTAPPPLAAGGGFGPRRKSNQAAREIVALDGLSLDVGAARSLVCLDQTAPGSRRRSAFSPHVCGRQTARRGSAITTCGPNRST
jgi:hypothetical protein